MLMYESEPPCCPPVCNRWHLLFTTTVMYSLANTLWAELWIASCDGSPCE